MVNTRVRDDDESTIVGSVSNAHVPATPPLPETTKVQKLLITTLALATIAFVVALPSYGASTLWVGPGAVILTYIYGTTLFVMMHQQKKAPMTKGQEGKEGKRKAPVVTRTPTLVCAALLAPVWAAACAMGLWRVTIEIRESREEMKAVWVALRFVEILCYIGGGVGLGFVGVSCSRARAQERAAHLQQYASN